ncbi:MAG: hypothetical protein WCA35_25535 [Kovacikia sp.]
MSYIRRFASGPVIFLRRNLMLLPLDILDLMPVGMLGLAVI